MKEPKYTTSFSATVRPLVDEEKDKYLAMASLIDVGEFIPEVDTSKNVDLLPIAFNSFVANRVNKNDDVVDAATTLAMYKQFINKPINIEHNRDRVIGVVLTAGFSEFGTDKVLTEEEVSGSDTPFNVTLGGVIWKIVNRGIAETIEDSADPTSEMYRKISASWELGFSDYNIIVMDDGEKNIANSAIITDSEKIGEMKTHLKGFGGEGKLENGKRVYRKVIGDVVPLGIGLTQSPAADVQGLAVKTEKKAIDKQKEDMPEGNPASLSGDSEEKPENNISQPNKLDVTKVSANHEEHFMKIDSIKDITDESLQELKATAVTDFIEEELKKASEEYTKQKADADVALKTATEATETLKKDHEELKEKLEKASSSLAELEKEKADREAEAIFTERMATMDDDYVLTDADREVLAGDIKEMEQEDFDKYATKMSVLMSSKKRELVEKAEAEAKVAEEATKKEEAEHEVKAETETTEEVVEEAVNQATETEAEVPAGAVTEEQTLREKYEGAFALDQFEIKHR